MNQIEADIAAMKSDLITLNIDMALVKHSYSTRTEVLAAKRSIVTLIVSAILLAQLLSPVLGKFGL